MSDDLGMGACGFGSCGFGFGEPAATTNSTARLLVKPDGTRGDCAQIDVASGDYVLDDAGNKVGGDSIEQMVFLALRTALGSAAVTSQGIERPTGVITDDLPARNRDAAAAALKSLIDRGLIELIDVITTRLASSRVQIETRWRRLPAGLEQSTFT